MKLFYKNKGVVSIFLILILVPIITITSLFIDASRLLLSKSVTDSAGDLALNTMMAQYDFKLNDYYGLLGSSVSVDDFNNKVKSYLKASVESAGISSGTMGDTISDLLSISFDEDTFSAAPISNSGLDNPAVLKTQIVNFMKYRAPIDGISELFEQLKELGKQSKGKQEEADLIEKKQDFANKENNLMENLQKIYMECKKYNECTGNIAPQLYLKGFIKSYKSYKKQYKEINQKVVCFVLYKSDMFDGVKDFKPKKIKVREKINNDAKKCDDIEECARKLKEWINAYNSKEKELEQIIKDYNNESTNETMRKVTYASKMNEAYTSTKEGEEGYITIIENIYSYKERLRELDENNDYEKEISDADNKYNNIMNNKSVYHQLIKHSKEYSVSVTEERKAVKKEESKINQEIKELSEKVNKYYDTLKEMEKKIDNILSTSGRTKRLLGEYINNLNNYKNSAKTLADKDNETGKKEVENLNNKNDKFSDGYQIEEIKKNVTDTTISKFRKRLQNIKTMLQQMRNGLSNTKLGDKKIKDIKDVKTFSTELKKYITKEEVKKLSSSELKEKANNVFEDIYIETSFDESWLNVNNEEYCPNLSSPANSDYTKLYDYIRNKFKEYDEGKVKEGKDKKAKYDDIKKEQEKKGKEEQGKEYELGEIADKFKNTHNSVKDNVSADNTYPSDTWNVGQAHNLFGNSNSNTTDLKKATNLFQSILGRLSMLLTSARDDLYTLDYVQKMFTYDTFVRERLYDIAKDKGKDISDFEHVFAAEKDKSVTDVFNSIAITNRYNHTMTNKLICSENNYAFGGEMEYIVFGKDSLESKAIVWGLIFAIKFVFNTVYAFIHMYNDTTITSIATGISELTCGVIPIPLVKIGIILALSVAETVSDIAELKIGMPVPIIKSENTFKWSISEDNIVKKKDNSTEHFQDKLKFRYSDYLKLFLFIGLASGQANEDKVYLRISDVIQHNMQLHNSSFSMQKSKTWFTISAKYKVDPIMLNLPINSDSTGSMTTDWCSYNYKYSNGYY